MNIENKEILDKLVTEIYTSGWLVKQCKRFSSDINIVDEFCQEIILKIYEKPNPKLIELYLMGDNYLSYIYVMVRNDMLNKKSKLYKQITFDQNLKSIDCLLEVLDGTYNEDVPNKPGIIKSITIDLSRKIINDYFEEN